MSKKVLIVLQIISTEDYSIQPNVIHLFSDLRQVGRIIPNKTEGTYKVRNEIETKRNAQMKI
jgi:hypothetical protein